MIARRSTRPRSRPRRRARSRPGHSPKRTASDRPSWPQKSEIERMRTQEKIGVQEQEVLRKAEGARSDRHQAGRSRAAGGSRPRRGGKAGGDSGSGGSPIRDDLRWPKPNRKNSARKAPAARRRSRRRGRAEAAKIEAIGLAQAKAIEAQGVAEAAAILRKAEAWKQFNDAARLQTVLKSCLRF